MGGQKTYTEQFVAGTCGYDGHPGSSEEYRALLDMEGNGDHEAVDHVKQPVYIQRNCYFNGAAAYRNEKDAVVGKEDLSVRIEKAPDGVYLNINVPEELCGCTGAALTTEQLGMPRIVEQRYENPDGSEIIFDKDIRGDIRQEGICPGPVHLLNKGKNRIKVWQENLYIRESWQERL